MNSGAKALSFVALEPLELSYFLFLHQRLDVFKIHLDKNPSEDFESSIANLEFFEPNCVNIITSNITDVATTIKMRYVFSCF